MKYRVAFCHPAEYDNEIGRFHQARQRWVFKKNRTLIAVLDTPKDVHWFISGLSTVMGCDAITNGNWINISQVPDDHPFGK